LGADPSALPKAQKRAQTETPTRARESTVARETCPLRGIGHASRHTHRCACEPDRRSARVRHFQARRASNSPQGICTQGEFEHNADDKPGLREIQIKSSASICDNPPAPTRDHTQNRSTRMQKMECRREGWQRTAGAALLAARNVHALCEPPVCFRDSIRPRRAQPFWALRGEQTRTSSSP